MSKQNRLGALELAALLSSRICHDAIGPIGAIGNGLEVLEEETDEDMREFALDTIRKSANRASASLQFSRLAFGAAGSVGTEIDLRDVENVARGVVEGERHKLEWQSSLTGLRKDYVKLILNMVAIALTALPRGGTIEIAITGSKARPEILIRCAGSRARIPEGVPELIAGRGPAPTDARAIQPYYTGLLADAVNMRVDLVLEGEDAVLQTVFGEK